MRSLQGTFPRCKKRLPGNASKFKKVIQSIVLFITFEQNLLGLTTSRLFLILNINATLT
jgi:hypothetical protein